MFRKLGLKAYKKTFGTPGPPNRTELQLTQQEWCRTGAKATSWTYQLPRVGSQLFGFESDGLHSPVSSGSQILQETSRLRGFLEGSSSEGVGWARSAILPCSHRCLPEAPQSMYRRWWRYHRVSVLCIVYNRLINITTSLVSRMHFHFRRFEYLVP